MHLKHFTGDQPKGHIWTYDAQKERNWSSTPENTAVETHFYSIEKEDGTLDVRIEEHLAKAENDAAPIYEALLNGRFPSGDERALFAHFLALMHVRTPTMRRMTGEIYSRQMQIMSYAYGTHGKAFERMIKDIENERGEVIDEKSKEQVRQWLIDPSQHEVRVSKQATLQGFAAADKLTEIFFSMNWSVFEPQHGYLITSDNPLYRRVNPKSVHKFYGDHGFVNKTAEVSFPLSRKKLLMMSWQGKDSFRGYIPREYTEAMNEFRAANSDRYLYAHIDDKRVMRLATRLREIRPSMTTQGFGPKLFAKTKVVRRLNEKD